MVANAAVLVALLVLGLLELLGVARGRVYGWRKVVSVVMILSIVLLAAAQLGVMRGHRSPAVLFGGIILLAIGVALQIGGDLRGWLQRRPP